MDGYIKWLRDRIGHQKILLVYASVCIVDDDGRLLWQQRGDMGWWGLPGGVLELDEDLETCAVREAREETGLDVSVDRLIGVYSSPDYDLTYPNGDEIQQVSFCFAAKVVGGKLDIGDDGETLALAWHRLGDFPETKPWYRQMAEDLRADRPDAIYDGGRPGLARDGEPYFKRIRRHIGPAPFISASSIGAVFDDQGRLLLVRRAEDEIWTLPGGMVEPGERVDRTVVSELKEETGLDVEPLRLLGVYSGADYTTVFANGDVLKSATCLFRCRLVGGKLRPDMEEIVEARFFPVDDLPEILPRHGPRVELAIADPRLTLIG